MSTPAVPDDGETSDLRTGAPLHDDLLALLPLLGRWEGGGDGVSPDGESFRYVQRIVFAHDGRPFVGYDSHTWLVDEHGAVIRPAMRETGFWRPGVGADDVEVVLALGAGLSLVFTGHVGQLRWEIASTSVVGTPTAKDVDGDRRLYALVDGDLAYAQELAPAGRSFAPHLSGRLARVSSPR